MDGWLALSLIPGLTRRQHCRLGLAIPLLPSPPGLSFFPSSPPPTNPWFTLAGCPILHSSPISSIPPLRASFILLPPAARTSADGEGTGGRLPLTRNRTQTQQQHRINPTWDPPLTKYGRGRKGGGNGEGKGGGNGEGKGGGNGEGKGGGNGEGKGGGNGEGKGGGNGEGKGGGNGEAKGGIIP
nr:uncharacterized protein LOC112286817 [Physcomitrium patens]|eukprot:XP_024384891.1 uncharacterized protein LOC112286817 [Physcomitrella patens]